MDYRHGEIPQDPAAVPGFLLEELPKLQQVLNNPQSLMWLEKRYSAPPKPREGFIAFADGTTWNPGTGKGIYYYDGSGWVKLG